MRRVALSSNQFPLDIFKYIIKENHEHNEQNQKILITYNQRYQYQHRFLTMKTQTRKGELYFSSDDDQGQVYTQSTAMAIEGQNSHFQDNISQMSGREIFDIFCDEAQLRKLINTMQIDRGAITRFFWRIHYIIGQIILHIQEQLVQYKKLDYCLLLADVSIERIITTLIKLGQTFSSQPEYCKVRDAIHVIYNENEHTLAMLTFLYNSFNNWAYQETNFKMAFNFNKETRIKNNIIIPEDNRRVQVEINNFYEQRQRMAPRRATQQPQMVKYPLVNSMSREENPRIGQYSVSHMPEKNPQPSLKDTMQVTNVTNNPGPSKLNVSRAVPNNNNLGNKWNSNQLTVFCKIYAEHSSPSVCVQLMEEQLGPDSRWNNPSQIETKMYSLVERVFQKFQQFKASANPITKEFKEQKEFVLSLKDKQTRKNIFKNIATIFESMMNVTTAKKAVFLNKVSEVNRLCRQAKMMRK